MIEPTDENRDRDMPEDPQTRPDDAVDALEERVFGERAEQNRDDDSEKPAFRHDIDTGDPDSQDAGPDEPTE